MSLNPNFRAASEAAEQSLEWLTAAERLAVGKPDDARACLEGVAALATSELSTVLISMRDTLARVAEGKIVSHGPAGLHHYSSAHEAVDSLWTTVALLMSRPDVALPSNLLDLLGVNVSALRSGLVRERARLLGQAPPEALCLGNGRFRIGDKTIALEFQEAAVLEALAQLGAATRPELEKKSGVEDAVGILKKLREKFPDLAPHIALPGKRGQGGYSTTIRAK